MVIFAAPYLYEAAHWAELWGFARGEWQFATPHTIRGWSRDTTVFVCGSTPLIREAETDIKSRFDLVIDAQDIDVPGNHEWSK